MSGDPYSEPKMGELGCDSHADTCCLGKGWAILERSGVTCDVIGFSDKIESLSGVEIVTGYTAYDDPISGNVYILHIAQALDLGREHEESLLPKPIAGKQLRSRRYSTLLQ